MNLSNISLRIPLIALFAICLIGTVPQAANAGIADRSAVDYIERALEYQNSGKLNAAIIELKNAIQLQPNNAFARITKGNIHFELGEIVYAIKEFQRARKLGARTVDWIVPLAESMLRFGRFDVVLDYVRIDDEFENFPDDIRASLFTVRGNAHRSLSQLDEAVASFEMALHASPNHASALVGLSRVELHREDLDKAEEWFAKAIAATKPGDAEILGLEGDLAMARGDIARAETAYRSLADLPSNDATRPLPLAFVLVQNGKFDEAIAHIDDVLSRLPDHPLGLHLRAAAANETGEYETALVYSDRLLKNFPEHLPTQLIAAAASYSLGRYDVAHRYLTEILSLWPGHKAAQRLFGETLLRMGRTGEAVNALQPLIDKNDAEVLAMIGEAAIRGQNLEMGRIYLERYNEVRPNDPNVLTQLGLLRLGLGDVEAGMTALEEALQANPEHDPAKLALFTIAMRKGNFGEAVAVARQFQQELPEKAAGFVMEGTANQAGGDVDAARKAFELALSIEPGDPGASANLSRIAHRQGDVEEARNLLLTSLELNPGHIGTLMALASLEAEANNLGAVLELFEEAVSSNPGAVVPRILLARIHLEQGRPLLALNATQGLVTNNGENPALLEVVGEAQLGMGQNNIAATTLRHLVRLRPYSARAYQLLAAAYSATTDPANAEKALRQALEIDSAYVWAAHDLTRLLYSQGNDEAVIAVSTEALRHTEEDPILLEMQGRALLRQFRPDEALEPLARLAAGRPEYAEARYLHGLALGRTGHIDDAVEELVSTIKLQSGHQEARLVLAGLYFATDKLDLASKEIEELRGTMPRNTQLLELDAAILMRRGDFAGATAKLQLVMRVEPREDRAVRLSQAQWKAGEGQAAIDTLVEWLEHNADGALSRASLAESYLRLGQIDAASAEYNRLFAVHEGTPASRNNYAWALWKQGRIEAARDQAERALAKSPDDPSIQDTLGVILLTAGDLPAAVNMLRRATKSAPRQPHIAFHLAQALAQSGDQPGAVEILNRLLSGTTDFAERGEAQQLRSTLTN